MEFTGETLLQKCQSKELTTPVPMDNKITHLSTTHSHASHARITSLRPQLIVCIPDRPPQQDANQLVQNFLNSIGGGSAGQQSQADKPFPSLSDLLNPATTTSYISKASPTQIDELCALLPGDIFILAAASSSDAPSDSSPAAAQAAIQSLSMEQKKQIITRVLRSPQLQQSLGSLTSALREGGLPMIGEALRLKVENQGLIRGGAMPLGGGQAVEAFVEGVKRTVEDELKEKKK